MIKIKKKTHFSYNKPPLIIAEISGNHGGSKKRFLKLIDLACKNGADLIKIQTYEPKDITIKSKKSHYKIKNGIWKNKFLWDIYKKACTPFSWHKEAFKIAKKNKKIIFSSPFSKRAVDLLESLKVPIYKIASFEITDVNLIKYIASKNKPIIISTGMSTISEIKFAIKIIEKFHKKIVILHCVSNYPTNVNDTNLSKIQKLKKIFKNYMIGLSDHTNDIYSSIASVPLGVVAIEKHFKMKNQNTLDSEFSITPKQLKILKENTLNVFQSLKNKKKDSKINIKFRRSIFASKLILKNERLTEKNIECYRPEIGIKARDYFKILGKITRKKINKHDPIFYYNLK